MKTQTDQTNMATDTSQNEQPQEATQEGDGIDQIISVVEGYIQDPKTVTRSTLMALKSDLMDLKDYLAGEDQTETQDQGNAPNNQLSSMMANMRGGK